MSGVAVLPRESRAEPEIVRNIDQFLEHVVENLPYDDFTGRLQRWQYVSDRLELELSKKAERLAEQFANHEIGIELAQVLWQLSHARRRLELRLWRTSPLFCKTR